MDILLKISESLQNGKSDDVARFTREAIDAAIDAKQILDDGLIAGMGVVGEKFRKHEVFLPDLLFSAKAMYAGLDLLKPLFVKEGIPTIGKVVIGTVRGDQHDIGKNLVGIMLEGAGFTVINLGKDVSPAQFLDAAEAESADVVGMSALLTTTMPVMKETIELAKERGLYGKIKFLVGGAPLSNEYAKQIGADAYCFDTVSAVDCVRKFVGAA